MWFLSSGMFVVADFMTSLALLIYYFQWWFKGFTVAAEAIDNWFGKPPPWPDETYIHRYPRHRRKFGVYYCVKTWAYAMGLLFPPASGHITVNFTSLADSIHCFSSTGSPIAMLIVDSGASVCITPHKSDFISYSKSKMKIKDLSSCTKVNGEGLVRWTVNDSRGEQVQIDVPGYHMKTATVRLLSPQVLLHHFGGTATQTAESYRFILGSGIDLTALYCPHRNC